MKKVFLFDINLDWKLIAALSEIDRFDASWSSIEKKEGRSLRQLKSIATLESVGASTRIEGSSMSNAEVDKLIENFTIDKLDDRDSQEVAGYFETLDLILESYAEINVTQNSIKNLHNRLMKYNVLDQWHKGEYKQHHNSVQASFPDGSTRIVFETTPPGVETEDAMRVLIDWYSKDNETHDIVKVALFAYEFVSIHPFQDGNGRLCRLLSTLLLLKCDYKWIEYVSFEHEIESRRSEYYSKLRQCQSQRPGEEITPWVYFFFDALISIQNKLMQKLETSGLKSKLSPKEKSILAFISNHPGSKSGEISLKLSIPNPTVKRLLRDLVAINLIERFGSGAGTNYSIK